MTFFAIETIDSGAASYSDGKPTVVRKFTCYDDAVPLTWGNLNTALLYGNLACLEGRTPPNCIGYIGQTDGDTGLPLRAFDIQPVKDRASTFVVTCTFTNGSASGDDSAGGPGFQEFSMSVGRTFVDGWRGSPDTPPDGPPGASDISGDPLDSMGEPVSIPVLTQEMSMGLMMTGSQLSSELGYWRGRTNTRNNNSYLGADPGTLLFPGATVDRVGPDLYRANIVLYWDEFKHCRQVPLREADGSPKISGKTAEEVYWVQPFPVLTGFDFGVGLP